MAQHKNSANTRTKGRKWATQRLPASLVIVIRQMAEKRGISPAEMVALAFESNPDLSREFDRTLHPWKGLITALDALQGRLDFGVDK